MGREENRMIFEDTERLCKENPRLQEALKNAVAGQKMIPEAESLSIGSLKRYEEPAKVVVSKKRSFEAASAYQGQRTAVHNFASASNPGGGVERGASAQEECLCRCSTLFFCLSEKEMRDKFYNPHRAARDPIHNDDIIYTPGVVVFKTDTANPKLMKENEWYEADVITCAAPNLRERPSNQYNSGDGDKSVKLKDTELLAIHEKRLRRILDVAFMEKAETVILGAFGCGAFANKPEVVAQASKHVLGDYLYAFRNIEYAVCCRPGDDVNYKTFERVLGKL